MFELLLIIPSQWVRFRVHLELCVKTLPSGNGENLNWQQLSDLKLLIWGAQRWSSFTERTFSTINFNSSRKHSRHWLAQSLSLLRKISLSFCGSVGWKAVLSVNVPRRWKVGTALACWIRPKQRLGVLDCSSFVRFLWKNIFLICQVVRLCAYRGSLMFY